MPLHLTKLPQIAGTALLIGCLAPQSFAQTNSIVPSAPAKPATGAPVPAVVAPPLPAPGKVMMEELTVRDADVAELINMISQGFNIPTIIAPGVSGIILPMVNLPRIAPEAAIEKIALAGGLKFRKQADGTYLIAKSLPDDGTDSNATASAPGITLPGQSSFSSNPFGTGSTGVLPSLGSAGSGMDSMAGLGVEMPQLSNDNPQAERKSNHLIQIRNIPAAIMAYQLDPSRNPMPIQMQRSNGNESRYGRQPIAASALSVQDQTVVRDAGSAVMNSGFNAGFNTGTINPYTQQRDNSEIRANAQFGGGGQGNRGGGQGGRGGNQRGGAGGGVFDLPTGVDRIVAIDPQNALLVFGTDEGVRELTDTIAFLDRPLRQVEIEAQFVTVQTGLTNAFGINYNTSQGNFNATAGGFAPGAPNGAGSLQVGFVRGNFQATLSALVSQNRAKVITAPRVLAINNLTATLTSTTGTPVLLTSTTTGIGGQVGTNQNLIFIQTTIGLTVTPTINNDDTITVLMQPEVSNQTPGTGGIPGFTQQTLETIANVHDGDTIALGGLKLKSITRNGDKIPVIGDLPLIGGLFRSKTLIDTDSDLIIFLTARIVRRADDDGVVPGT